MHIRRSETLEIPRRARHAPSSVGFPPGGLRPTARCIGVWAALVATGLVGCSSPPGFMTPAHRAALQDSVRVAMDDFQTRSAAEPAIAISELYSTDPAFRMYENGRLAYTSVEEIRRSLAALGPDARVRTEFHDPHILALGPGQALVHTGFSSTFGQGQEAFSFAGVMTLHWVHEGSGWRIRSGHTSSPARPDGEVQGRASDPEGPIPGKSSRTVGSG